MGEKIRQQDTPRHKATTDQFCQRKAKNITILIHALVISAIGILIYANTLDSPFFFDDLDCIRHNPIIKNLKYFYGSASVDGLSIGEDIKNNFFMRPVAYLTFALNYHCHGLNVKGYHAINIAIHISNTLLVYMLIHLTISAFRAQQAPSSDNNLVGHFVSLMPLYGALLFMTHPLQTQAVTYIVQRFTSLSTFFYLASLVVYARYRLHHLRNHSLFCYMLALILTISAMKTASYAFTLPITILIYELMFLSGNLKKRLKNLLPFFLTMLIVPWTVIGLAKETKKSTVAAMDEAINLMNFTGVSRHDYLITQFKVIVKYMQLLIFPVEQNLDYDYPFSTSFFELKVLLGLSIILTLVGLGFWQLYISRNDRSIGGLLSRLFAFGIFWFFICISISSSIIPIDDPIFEHRAYLPSVGFFMASLAGTALALRRLARIRRRFYQAVHVSFILIVVALSAATVLRNNVWADELTLYQDIALKSPNKARARNNFGVALLKNDRFEEALHEFHVALAIAPGYFISDRNIGVTLLKAGHYEAAATHFGNLLLLAPDDYVTHYFLGMANLEMGDRETARSLFKTALTLNPKFNAPRYALGVMAEEEGKSDKAMGHFEAILESAPKNRRALMKIEELSE